MALLLSAASGNNTSMKLNIQVLPDPHLNKMICYLFGTVSKAKCLIAGLEKSPRMVMFGCCGAVMVHLYKEETFNMKENGMLKSITPAYSHQPGHSKV